MSPDPPPQPAAVDFAAFVGNVVEHFPQIHMLVVGCRCLLHGIAHHRRCLAEYRLPCGQQAVQRFAIRVLRHGFEYGFRCVGQAQPKQRLAAKIGPVAVARHRLACDLWPAGHDPGPHDDQCRRDIPAAFMEHIPHQLGPLETACRRHLTAGVQVDRDAAPGHILHRSHVVAAGQEQGAGTDGSRLGNAQDAPAHEF